MLDTLKIRQLRERRGMTLEEAARAAGWMLGDLGHRQRWATVESGQVNPSLATAVAVARALHVKVDDLLVDQPADKRPARRNTRK